MERLSSGHQAEESATTNQDEEMKNLEYNEILEVAGGIDQGTVISTNLGIVGIGVGILVVGASAPFWFPAAMIGISASTLIFMEY